MRIENIYTCDLYTIYFRHMEATKVWPNQGATYPAESWGGTWSWALGNPVYEVQRESRYPGLRGGIEG